MNILNFPIKEVKIFRKSDNKPIVIIKDSRITYNDEVYYKAEVDKGFCFKKEKN